MPSRISFCKSVRIANGGCVQQNMLKNRTNYLLFFLTVILLIVVSLTWLTAVDKRTVDSFVRKQGLSYEPDTLRVNLGAEPPSLDWAKATDATSFDVVSNIMVGLTAYQKDLSCAPAGAASWKIADKGKCYIFHIRPDMRWSDGKAVTAYDFAYGWKRLLDPKTAAPYAFFFI